MGKCNCGEDGVYCDNCMCDNVFQAEQKLKQESIYNPSDKDKVHIKDNG